MEKGAERYYDLPRRRKRSSILTTNAPEKEYENGDLPRGYIEDVPDCLAYKKFKLETGCGRLYLFVGYDIYIAKKL